VAPTARSRPISRRRWAALSAQVDATTKTATNPPSPTIAISSWAPSQRTRVTLSGSSLSRSAPASTVPLVATMSRAAAATVAGSPETVRPSTRVPAESRSAVASGT
jgi:hypothetical protein